MPSSKREVVAVVCRQGGGELVRQFCGRRNTSQDKLGRLKRYLRLARGYLVGE